MELLNKLGIDWKLILAQIVSFAILAFVLHKFVYKVVLDALDHRSQLIEKGVRDAKKSEERLMQIETLAKERMHETQKEVGVLLDRARKDAEGMKQEILAAANTQAEDLVRRTKAQLAEEKEKILQEVRSEVGSLVLKLATKLLDREFAPADQARLSTAIMDEMKSI